MPIRLNTKLGLEQFNILVEQRNNYTKLGLSDEFVDRCKTDLASQETYLEFFLDSEALAKKYKMDETDSEGFLIFNEQSDVVSSLRYFSGGVM